MDRSQSGIHSLLRPARERGWRIESSLRSIAGAIVLLGLVLSLRDPRWLWLVAFVGLNLLQSGLTGWCLMSNLLGELGKRSSAMPPAR
ncbi:MAG: DUF2892 domain-containing protein [Vulcanimicrobiaceae bacterium]